MNEFVFDIKLDAALPGWADLIIASRRSRVQVTCGDCIDSIGEIVGGLSQLLDADGEFDVVCDSESFGCEWLLTFSRRGEFFEFVAKKAIGGLEDGDIANQRARLRHRGLWEQAVESVVSAFGRLLDGHGIQGYEEIWGHRFPKEALKRLCLEREAVLAN